MINTLSERKSSCRMWILSVFVILPKTLLKWTTPHCKSATKFKAKLVRHQLSAEIVAAITTTKTILVAALAPISKNNNNNSNSNISSSVAEKAVAFNPKQYSSQLIIVECVPIAFLVSTPLLPATGPLFDIVLIFIVSLISLCIQHFLHNAVKSKLVFLMNDIRVKTLYKPTTKTTETVAAGTELTVILSKILRAIRIVIENNNNNNNNNINSNNLLRFIVEKTTRIITALTNQIPRISEAIAPLYSILTSGNSINIITVAALVQLHLFNNNSFSSNNHRTYNNGSKSNKVFLHYTPRDPRLRNVSENQEIFINKHQIDSVSELKITEDLCAYGEVIGGSSTIVTITKVSANLQIYCDCNQIINCNHTCNLSEFDGESESERKSIASRNLIISESSHSNIISSINSLKLIYKETQTPTHPTDEEVPKVKSKFLRNSLGSPEFNAAYCTVGILL